MKILVTGGAGYIGSHTVVELFSAGYTPVIIDNFSNSQKSVLNGLHDILGCDVVCHEGDCCDENFMRQVFEKEKDIEGVIHFAALKAVGESIEKPELYRKNNVESTQVLIKIMKAFDVSLLVFSSTACVYGDPDNLPLIEAMPFKKPQSPYAETKQVCENIIEEAVNNDEDLKAISLRYFNPIGAHQSIKIGEMPIGVPNNLVPFITQSVSGKFDQLIVFGNDYNTADGTAIRDYVHVVDVSKAHVIAMKYLIKNDDSFYEVFNLGEGKGYSVLDVINAFKDATGIDVNYTIGPRRDGDVAVLCACAKKAKEQLGWQAELSLVQALKDAWQWQCHLES